MDKTRVAAVHGSGDMVLVMVNMQSLVPCCKMCWCNAAKLSANHIGAKLSAIWCNIECNMVQH